MQYVRYKRLGGNVWVHAAGCMLLGAALGCSARFAALQYSAGVIVLDFQL